MRRVHMRALVLVAALAYAGGVAGQTPAASSAPATSPSDTNTDDGKELFVSYGCYQCHGREGQGSSATGPRLAQRLQPQARFESYVRNPTGVMPPYATAILPDSDLGLVYEFLRTRPAPPSVESLPQLR